MKNRQSQLVLWLFFIFLLRFALSFLTAHNDIYDDLKVQEVITQRGTKNLYEFKFKDRHPADCPPLNYLLQRLFYKFYHLIGLDPTNPNWLAAFYKVPSLLADIGLVYLFYKLLLFQKPYWYFFLLNPALFYNSIFWGQTESLITFLVFLSFFLFFRQKTKWLAPFVFLAAVLIKQTALFFLPVFLVLFLRSFRLRTLIVYSIIAYAMTVFLFSFFTTKSYFFYPLKFFWDAKIGVLRHATVEAWNLWYLLELNYTPDKQLFLGISYKIWGIVLTLSLVSLVLRNLISKKVTFSKIIHATFLVSFAVFLFLTRMHERHLYYAIAFLTPIVFSQKHRPFHLLLYAFLSFIHFFNLFLIFPPPSLPMKYLFIIFYSKQRLVVKSLIIAQIAIFFYFLFDFLKTNLALKANEKR